MISDADVLVLKLVGEDINLTIYFYWEIYYEP